MSWMERIERTAADVTPPPAEAERAATVQVSLTAWDWWQLTGLLQQLGTGSLLQVNNPAVVITLRDRIVKQLP